MTTELTRRGTSAAKPRSDWLQRQARRAVLARLSRVAHGELTVIEGQDSRTFGTVDEVCDRPVKLEVLDPEFYIEVALGGSVGGAEAYIRNYWTCSDLTGLVRLLICNRHVLDAMESGLARMKGPLRRLSHWARRNHEKNSRRNISAHYDLGNDFFELFLDPTMMYSSALFAHKQASLRSASVNKLERICRKLGLNERDHVIEIGTGWGGFALHAAGNYGCRVTTTTISEEQFRMARQRVQEQGLEQRVSVIKKDYRDLEGEYDKLVSIEMIEAVGHGYFDTFFRKCSELLKPDGHMMLQAITISDQQYEKSRKSVDFIQKYIFPGGALPSVGAMIGSLRRATDLKLVDMVDIGPHYAETLRRWRDRFFRNIDRVRKLGFTDEFIRMWEYYFCYCEAGFDERVIGDVQLLLRKPMSRAGALS